MLTPGMDGFDPPKWLDLATGCPQTRAVNRFSIRKSPLKDVMNSSWGDDVQILARFHDICF